MPLEEYLVGVVAAEMPADFEREALRAQAVAARTYALYCAGTGRHADADVCTDYRCCQAWKSDEALRKSWGGAYGEKLARVSGAVESTAGQYLRFAGKPAFTPPPRAIPRPAARSGASCPISKAYPLPKTRRVSRTM